jgi:hypothetical protein
MERKLALWALAAVAMLAGSARAAVITATNTTVIGNSASTPIVFNVSGGETIAGASFIAEINAGTTGPLIASVDLTSGVLAPGNNGQTYVDQTAIDNSAFAGRLVNVSTDANSVSANGQLAILYVNTTGLTSGTFTVNLLGTHEGDTVLTRTGNDPIIPNYTTTTFTIVPAPEPGTLLLGVAGGAFLLTCRRKSKS